MGNGIYTPCTFRNYDKKFQKFRINIYFVVCILVFAPYLDFELPLGSSGSESMFLQGDLASIHIQELWQKNQKSTIIICIVVVF